MIIRHGDMFAAQWDILCIPTNARRNIHGEAIMGAGVAKEAARRWPNSPSTLGHDLAYHGARVTVIEDLDDRWVVAFPTKNDYRHRASHQLIKHSAEQLVALSAKWTALWGGEKKRLPTVVLPAVGAGLGGLSFEQEVRPILDTYLVSPNYHVYLLD